MVSDSYLNLLGTPEFQAFINSAPSSANLARPIPPLYTSLANMLGGGIVNTGVNAATAGIKSPVLTQEERQNRQLGGMAGGTVGGLAGNVAGGAVAGAVGGPIGIGLGALVSALAGLLGQSVGKAAGSKKGTWQQALFGR